WRLYSYRVGLLAAALSALAVMQIQQSHFMTADNFGTLFTALAMGAAVMIATEHRNRQDDRRRTTDDHEQDEGRKTKDEAHLPIGEPKTSESSLVDLQSPISNPQASSSGPSSF